MLRNEFSYLVILLGEDGHEEMDLELLNTGNASWIVHFCLSPISSTPLPFWMCVRTKKHSWNNVTFYCNSFKIKHFLR